MFIRYGIIFTSRYELKYLIVTSVTRGLLLNSWGLRTLRAGMESELIHDPSHSSGRTFTHQLMSSQTQHFILIQYPSTDWSVKLCLFALTLLHQFDLCPLIYVHFYIFLRIEPPKYLVEAKTDVRVCKRVSF